MARPDIEADADAAQLAFDRSVRRYEWRRLVGWLLLALGGLMAVVHLLSHSKAIDLRLSPSTQDLVLGYPMAGLLVLAAAISLGQLHPAERRGGR